MRTKFWSLILKGREHSEDLDIDMKMDSMDIRWEGMDWIYLAQDRDQWRALLITVMNLRIP
jgi:hypothetical protein